MSQTMLIDDSIPGFYRDPLVTAECRPFTMRRGGKASVLFLHGFTGSPADFRRFAALYHDQGYDVFTPLMPGHGSHVSQLERLSYRELAIPFPPVYQYLRTHYQAVHLCALSYGCVPAVELALADQPKTLCFLAPAFQLTREQEQKIAWAKRIHLQKFRGRVSKSQIRSGFNQDPDPTTYDAVGIRAALELHQRAEELRGELKNLGVPVFHAHGDLDQTTPAGSNRAILSEVVTNYTFYGIREAGHVLPTEPGNEDLAKTHIAWMREQD